MADPKAVPVCTWPDGRVVARTDRNLGRDWICFHSYPEWPGAAADIEFGFELDSVRRFTDTLPGFQQGIPISQFNPETVIREAKKLLWFVTTIGLTDDQRMLPRDLFHAPPASGKMDSRTPRVPLFLPDDIVLAKEIPSRPSRTVEQAFRLARDSLGEGASMMEWRPIGSDNNPNARPEKFRFLMNRSIPRWMEAEQYRMDGTNWCVEWGNSSEQQGRGTTFGTAVNDLLRKNCYLPESEKESWLTGLKPGALVQVDSLDVFRLLGEPCPLIWPWPRFIEWATQSGLHP